MTAAAVFGVGMLVLPPIESAAPPPPPPAPPPPPPAPPPPPPPADAATDASADVKAAPDAAALEAVAPAAVEPAPAPAKPVETPPAPPPPAPAPTSSASGAKPSDKETAREAWRKNLPDITTEPGKSAILIPIRGSIEGAVFHVTTKPRSVLVTLPKAESMITMEFYGIKRDGFRQLWIKKTDDGTTLRLVLGDVSDPQVEIKDEFVRVTVRRPVEGSPAAAPAAADGGTD
ncbi:MAG TPA: hypothetical protein VHJ20_12655 [Polyangia bacterium]|nr:hypothetical protein [Polyangia bacterium]